MTSKELVQAFYASGMPAVIDYEAMVSRAQDEDVIGRDLTLAERNIIRGWYGMPPEVSETEQCA